MNNRQNEDRDKTSNPNPKPDSETLHTTDPQKNMEGPFSSTMQETGQAFNTSESKEEAEEEKENKM